MTDLATQQKAGKASGDDAVEAEQAVDDEASATAGSAESRALDETDADTPADAETADAVAPADEPEDSPAVEAEAEGELEDEPAVEPEAAPEDDAESDDDAAAEPDAAPEDGAAADPESSSAEATDAEAGVEVDAAAEPKDARGDDAGEAPEAPVEPEADVEPEATVEPEADAEPEDDAEPENHAEIEDDAAGEPEVEPDAEPEPIADLEPENEAVAEPDAEPVADLEPDAEPKAHAVPEAAEPEADEPDTDPEPTAEADLETAAMATTVLAPPAPTALLPTAAGSPETQAAVAAAAAGTPTDGSVYAWAPAEPQPRKKHTAIWISAAAGVAVVGLVVSSLVLIAPGTAVAGVPVGWLTPGAAAQAIEQRLAETTVVLTGSGEDAEITGAELGAGVDARALADAAFAEHPMWNPTAWFATTGAEVELDAATATEALRDAAPQLYTDPVDATLAFDPATATYVSTPAVAGTGVDVQTVQSAIQAAFEAGETRVQLDPVEAAIPADISTETADATVAQLNGMLDTVGFYVGDERTVPVDRAVAASWLSVAPDGDAFAITADPAAIQPVVDTLAAAVDRAPENAVVITDTGGKVLQTIAAGQSGRQLGDASGIAAAFAGQLGSGDAVFKLPVTEVPVSTTTLARNIVVDLSEQRTYIYENGQLVNSFLVSSGAAATPTHTGNFRINSHVRVQDMGALCYNPNAVNSYCTEDVPWVMYFNGDQGFHGTYWHNNFGNRMSHGCVNLPLGTAESLYSWAPNGTEVRVQA